MGGKRNSFFLPVGKLFGSNAWIVFFVNYIHAVFKMFSWLYWNLTNLTSNVELVSMLKNSQSCLGIIIKTSMCAARPVTSANRKKRGKKTSLKQKDVALTIGKGVQNPRPPTFGDQGLCWLPARRITLTPGFPAKFHFKKSFNHR